MQAVLLAVALLAGAGSAAAPDAAPTQTASPSPPAEPQALLNDSERAYAARDPAKGFALLSAALESARRRGDTPIEAEVLRRLGLAADVALDRPLATRHLDAALVLFERLGDRLGVARTRTQLASLLFATGDRVLGAQHAQRAVDLLRDGDDIGLRMQAYTALLYNLPDDEAAARARAAALALARDARRPDLACGIEHHSGDRLFMAGRYDESLASLTAARDCFHAAGQPAREGRTLVSLGRLYRAHGQLPRALETYQRALGLQEGAGDVVAAVQSMNAIAVTLGRLGRFDEAIARSEAALARARTAKLSRETTFLEGALGGTYLQGGRYAEALTLLAASLEGETVGSVRSARLGQQAIAYHRLGQPEKGLPIVDQALALASDLPEYQVDALENRALLRAALGAFADAEDDLARATTIVERLRAATIPTDVMRRGFNDTVQSLFSTRIEILTAQGRAREALEVAEGARARALLDLLAFRAAPGASPALPPAATEAPARLPEIVAAARRLRSTFLFYWVAPTAIQIWAVGPDGDATAATVPALETRLTALVNEATGTGAAPAATAGGLIVSSRAMQRPWRELHGLLIDPILAALPRTTGSRLTIVPHGPLFRLSFAGLLDAQGRYLLERHDLHYLPAAAVLRYTGRVRVKRGAERGALLIGDPGELAGDLGERLPSLPWSRREVQAVGATIGTGTTTLVGERATERALRASLRGRSLLHFATHGIVQSDPALPSYLALRGSATVGTPAPEGAGGADPDGDGRVTADEIYGLELDAELVVLSACRTALGPTTGEGVIGFTRGFLSAGAPSVVATLWDVSDRTTYDVMRGFHERRRASGRTSASLRRAQLAVLKRLRAGLLREGGQPLPDSPRLWAGVVVVGEPR